MSWRNRLRPEITLTSPDGDEFAAKWRGNDRNISKKLGVFEYPNFDGTTVQDLGVNGWRYQLTFMLDGEDHDIEAERFARAISQRGLWTVVHPTKGQLSLQLETVTEKIQPITNGNITEFSTTWIEPSAQTIEASTQQLAGNIEAEADDVNITAGEQFENNISLDTAGETLSLVQSIEQGLQAAEDEIRGLLSGFNELQAEFDTIVRSIDGTLDAIAEAPQVLAGQIQQLIQLPALIATDVQTKVDGFVAFIDRLIANPLGTNPDTELKNQISAGELNTTAAVVGMSLAVTSGEIETQAQAVGLVETLTENLAKVTQYLDNVQAQYNDVQIDVQYFSQSFAFSQLAQIVASANNYLLSSSLDLAVEKRFKLDRPRVPLEIAATEYGRLDRLDFFIRTNGLKSTEILLLPALREVVVYV